MAGEFRVESGFPREFAANPIGVCRLIEQIVLNDGTEAAMWMTMSNKSYPVV